MSLPINTPIPSEKFEDIWQEILPGLEPLPPEVRLQDPPPKRNPEPETRPENQRQRNFDTIEFLMREIAQECLISAFYRELIKKSPPKLRASLLPLEKSQKQAVDSLMTLCFLRTGEKPGCPNGCPFVCSIPHAFRNLCNEETRRARLYSKASERVNDRHEARVFSDIAEIKSLSSQTLMCLLGVIINPQR